MDAVAPDAVSPASIIPPQRLLRDLPAIELDDTAQEAVSHGRAVADPRAAGSDGTDTAVALVHAGELVAMARAESGWLKPEVVLLTT
jgi:tRNA U55 pseudouridine synthase TruB